MKMLDDLKESENGMFEHYGENHNWTNIWGHNWTNIWGYVAMTPKPQYLHW
jgi:hypothetical protein